MPKLAPQETCTGCMACMNACAKNALIFKEDEEGFLQPSVDSNICVECGLCERSCPEIQNKFHQNNGPQDTYAGWNSTDRCISSSGGAFSSIARYVLSLGGYVYGATQENLLCKHIEINTIEGLSKLRGSKYIQSNIGLNYKKVKKHLMADEHVLFSGTPCQISGLLSFLGKEYKKLITIDLICHGVPSQAVFSSYIEKLNKRLDFVGNEEVMTYEFRRRNGWAISPHITTTMNNSHKLDGVNSLYMSAFVKGATFRKSCYTCHYAKPMRVGDFSIGDFWGIGHYGVPFKYDTTKGVSLLIVNSEKGRSLMELLGRDDFYVKRTFEEAIAGNHNLSKVSNMNKNRDEIIKAFLDKNIGLDEIEQKYHLVNKSLKKRIATIASKFGVYDYLKKIYNIIGRL